jgi:hypothetical protein
MDDTTQSRQEFCQSIFGFQPEQFTRRNIP